MQSVVAVNNTVIKKRNLARTRLRATPTRYKPLKIAQITGEAASQTNNARLSFSIEKIYLKSLIADSAIEIQSGVATNKNVYQTPANRTAEIRKRIPAILSGGNRVCMLLNFEVGDDCGG